MRAHLADPPSPHVRYFFMCNSDPFRPVGRRQAHPQTQPPVSNSDYFATVLRPPSPTQGPTSTHSRPAPAQSNPSRLYSSPAAAYTPTLSFDEFRYGSPASLVCWNALRAHVPWPSNTQLPPYPPDAFLSIFRHRAQNQCLYGRVAAPSNLAYPSMYH